MERNRNVVFKGTVIIFIISIVFMTAILNSYSFINSCVEAGAENNTVVLASVKGRIEYGLRYGRELDNYYDIDEIFSTIEKYCNTKSCYIVDSKLGFLYGVRPPKKFNENIDLETGKTGDVYSWVEDDVQNIIVPISNGDETIAGYLGIFYPTDIVKGISDTYVKRMFIYALGESIFGIVLFLILFKIIKHDYDEKKLRALIIGTVIAVNIVSIIPMYFVLKNGYTELSEDVGTKLIAQTADDIDRIIDSGIDYSEISGMDGYLETLSDKSEQIDVIKLSNAQEDEAVVQGLSVDGSGDTHYLIAELSISYINRKIRTAIINVAIATITAIMIAVEVIIFLLAVLVQESRDRRKLIHKSDDVSVEHLGIVRGISFFFSSFRFMSAAFMSIVLTDIYKPVSVFGKAIPYAIVLSLPMTSQVFISMVTSYVAGSIIVKYGWKKITLNGIAVMIFGALFAALSREPVPFILAQMVMGVGLGLSKMGIDVYSVDAASKDDMSQYTAGANAGLIVGYSVAAALGAIIASIFGYPGAYFIMAIYGIGVFILIWFMGMNIVSGKQEEDEIDTEGGDEAGVDLRFPTYVMFIIIPYFFTTMFVEYFFPIHANAEGITTDVIGYVMLAYGIATAYIGTWICPRLTKVFSARQLMPAVILILALSFYIFANYNYIIIAMGIVVLIGITDGIMPSVQFVYVYDLPISKKIGFSKVLGIEGFFSNMIGAAAPMIFSMVLIYGNEGLIVVSAVIALAEFLFILINRKNVRKHKQKTGEEK